MTNGPRIIISATDNTQAAFRSVKQSLGGVQSAAATVRQALGAIGVGISVGAIVTGLTRAAGAAIQYGDEIAKATAKTGVGAQAFSELAYAARQNDVSLQALGTAFKKLQTTISQAGSGTKTAQDAFRALGIEFEQFRRLSPDRQFETIAEQISRLKDPADRTRAAVELFGRAGADLLPLFEQGAKGIRALREEAIRTGRSLTEDQVKKLAEADLAIKGLTASWESFARTLTAKVAPSLTNVLNQLQGINTPETDQANRAELQKLLNAPRWQRGIFALSGNEADARRELEQIEARMRQRRVLAVSRQPSGGASPPGFLPDPDKPGKDDPLSGLGEVGIYSREIFNFANAQAAAFSAFSASANEDLRKNVQDLTNETTRMLGTMTVETEQAVSAWAAFAEQGARNIQDSFAQFLFDPFSDGLKGMVQGFVDSIRQMLAQYLAFQAITGLGGALSGSSNPFISSVGSFLTGKRALGGPVTAGGAYLVGEAGPELFVPRSSGQIVPNGAMGGVTMNYTIDARGADADRIMAVLPPLLRQTEQRTVARVQELLQRGRLA